MSYLDVAPRARGSLRELSSPPSPALGLVTPPPSSRLEDGLSWRPWGAAGAGGEVFKMVHNVVVKFCTFVLVVFDVMMVAVVVVMVIVVVFVL